MNNKMGKLSRDLLDDRCLGRSASPWRRFAKTVAGVAGAVLGSGLLVMSLAQASPTAPKPIPGGFPNPVVEGETIHFAFPGPGAEPSLITDFSGFVGLADVTGTGTGTDTTTGVATPGLVFAADVRFMRGLYVGLDGNTHFGTFVFI